MIALKDFRLRDWGKSSNQQKTYSLKMAAKREAVDLCAEQRDVPSQEQKSHKENIRVK